MPLNHCTTMGSHINTVLEKTKELQNMIDKGILVGNANIAKPMGDLVGRMQCARDHYDKLFKILTRGQPTMLKEVKMGIHPNTLMCEPDSIVIEDAKHTPNPKKRGRKPKPKIEENELEN